MRLERFSDFGELPCYAERLRWVGFQLAAALFFVAVSMASALALSRTDALGHVHESARSGWRQVLTYALGPPRVGLQIGHDGAAAHPDELLHLRGNTGGYAAGLSELSINRAVAAALKEALEAQGVTVDLLRATPPAAYRADLLLALHADSVWDTARRGYKSATFDPPRSRLEPKLKSLIDHAYLGATGLSDDSLNTTGNMRRYYAFNFRRYAHSVHPATPSLIVELGYLSSTTDAALLQQPGRVAAALASGAVSFLQDRNRLP